MPNPMDGPTGMTPTWLDALIVVDFQRGFDWVSTGRRHNPACEANIVRLVEHWRRHAGWVVYVRHDSVEEGSPLEAGSVGNGLAWQLPRDPDVLVVKHVHSAFQGTPSLNAWLRHRNVESVTICGITTDHCCETTARAACDLGYRVNFVLDATRTFPRQTPAGEILPAEEVARAVSASLHGEFAAVVPTESIVGSGTGEPLAPAETGSAAAPRLTLVPPGRT